MAGSDYAIAVLPFVAVCGLALATGLQTRALLGETLSVLLWLLVGSLGMLASIAVYDQRRYGIWR
ncbi:hypothetical protein [Natrinema pallidum]|uniref:Uncharacterized protein n=1 Tax=Natrinema pallidum DSM 3751 TaxID=1227495 RepID=L9YGE6_9EURY|nr:hypothetical protein [Natrinema pallidum]ELY73195.1 hypothetical protein C487_17375 [Natrinema pallidum DSM 3751]